MSSVRALMIAEDDNDDYYILECAISEINSELLVRRANNGVMLMELLENDQLPDLLLLDLFMPCKNGSMCMLEIRRNKRYDHLPIIIYSSADTTEVIAACHNSGASLFVIKPDNYGGLMCTLEKLIAKQWSPHNMYTALETFILH